MSDTIHVDGHEITNFGQAPEVVERSDGFDLTFDGDDGEGSCFADLRRHIGYSFDVAWKRDGVLRFRGKLRIAGCHGIVKTRGGTIQLRV